MANIPNGFGNLQDLLKRFQAAQSRWELWRSLHQEAFDYAAPEREAFRFRTPGQRKNRHIFDSTAVLGLSQFSSRIQGLLFPSWQNWMNYEAGDEIPEGEREQINKALEESTDTFFSEINHSNFSTEITPTLSDTGIGTGAIMVEENQFGDDTILRFTNVPLAELYPEHPGCGAVKSVWRKQEVEPRNLKTTWPDADLPQELEQKIKNGDNNKIEIITGMLYNEKDKKYHQIVIHEGTKSVIFTQAFNTKRLIVNRWHVTPGEVFGRGPIVKVLPDIRTVNKIKQFVLENAALQMAGVYTGVSDGVFNPHTVRINPGTIIPVSSNNTSNPDLAALPLSGNLGLGDLVIEDLQTNIRKALFVDPLGEVTDPVKSATEQMLRNQDALRTQGASVGRQYSELVLPIVAAVTEILKSRGKIADFIVDGKEVTIKHQSPLAKAEELDDFQNSQVWFSNVAQLPPEVMAATVKVEELPRYWGEKLGIPPSLVRSKEETRQLAETVSDAAEAGIEGGQGGGV